MRDRPVADDLLALARDTVLQDLLPQLPPSAHYSARMVANAIAIARRESGVSTAQAEAVATLAALAGSDGPVEAWPHRLVMRIRAGAFDHAPASRRELLDALMAWTRGRVAIANPRILRSPAA